MPDTWCQYVITYFMDLCIAVDVGRVERRDKNNFSFAFTFALFSFGFEKRINVEPNFMSA